MRSQIAKKLRRSVLVLPPLPRSSRSPTAVRLIYTTRNDPGVHLGAGSAVTSLNPLNVTIIPTVPKKLFVLGMFFPQTNAHPFVPTVRCLPGHNAVVKDGPGFGDSTRPCLIESLLFGSFTLFSASRPGVYVNIQHFKQWVVSCLLELLVTLAGRRPNPREKNKTQGIPVRAVITARLIRCSARDASFPHAARKEAGRNQLT